MVMPTHDREGVSRYLIGSVTEKVVRLSIVSVLTARMQPDEQLVFPYENILIPTDGNAGAAHAAEYGLSLAAVLDATVHVLSVVDDTSLGLDVRSAISGHEREQVATDAVDDGYVTEERASKSPRNENNRSRSFSWSRARTTCASESATFTISGAGS